MQIRSHCFDEKKTVEIKGKKINIPGWARPRLSGGNRSVGASLDRRHLRRGTPRLAERFEGERDRPARRSSTNEWNKFRIECRGDSIKTWLNGVPAADLKDSVTPSGFIALQVHGVGKKEEALEVRFRDYASRN